MLLTNTITSFDISVLIIPFAKFIIILFAIFGFIVTFNNAVQVFSRAYKDKLDNAKDIHAKDKDAEITNNLLNKFPLVSPEFMQKKVKEQNIENNQEIHEIIEILKEHKARIEELENKY